jgi:hypothetical protein
MGSTTLHHLPRREEWDYTNAPVVKEETQEEDHPLVGSDDIPDEELLDNTLGYLDLLVLEFEHLASTKKVVELYPTGEMS